MLPEGLLQTAHLAHVDAYLSCSSHCCHQYPTRNYLRVEGLLLLAYGSRETFYSQPGNGSEQKVGTSYQTPRPAPRIPLPPAGFHFLKFPSPRQSAVDQISNTGANGKHVTSKSQQFLTEFQDLSPGYTQFCAGTRMQCSLAESMNLVILFLIFQKCSLHTFIPPCASGCC